MTNSQILSIVNTHDDSTENTEKEESRDPYLEKARMPNVEPEDEPEFQPEKKRRRIDIEKYVIGPVFPYNSSDDSEGTITVNELAAITLYKNNNRKNIGAAE